MNTTALEVPVNEEKTASVISAFVNGKEVNTRKEVMADGELDGLSEKAASPELSKPRGRKGRQGTKSFKSKIDKANGEEKNGKEKIKNSNDKGSPQKPSATAGMENIESESVVDKTDAENIDEKQEEDGKGNAEYDVLESEVTEDNAVKADGKILKTLEGKEYEVVIDDRIRNCLPPLSKAAHHALVNSCLKEGIRDKIVVMTLEEGTAKIIDGFVRFEIAGEHDLEFDITRCPAEVATYDEAMLWRIETQIARRNFNRFQNKYYLGLAYNTMKMNDEDNLKQRWIPGVNYEPPPKVIGANSTAAKLAKKYNTSGMTVRRCEKYYLEVEEVLKHFPEHERVSWRNRILQGEITVDKIKTEQTQSENRQTTPESEEQKTLDAAKKFFANAHKNKGKSHRDRNRDVYDSLNYFARYLGDLLSDYAPDCEEWGKNLDEGITIVENVLYELKKRMKHQVTFEHRSDKQAMENPVVA